MNRRILTLLVAPLIVLCGTASASTDQAVQHLHTAVNEIMATAQHATSRSALQTSVRPILEKYISFDAMTRRAIGPGWRQFTPDQQKEAVKLFTTLIIRTYTSHFTPGELPVVKFEAASETAPGRVEVPTNDLYEGSHYAVTYRIEQAEDWRITDVVIEGVSLIANYRAQFDSEFTQGGATAVLGALNRSANAQQ